MLVPDCRLLMLQTLKALADGKALVVEQPVPYRNLGKRVIAERLRQNGLRVALHDDHLPPDAPDEEWRGSTEAEA